MAAIDFPDAPNLGDTFTVNDKTWTWNGNTWELVATPAGKSGSVTTIADTAPSNPALGDEWFNSSTGRRYTYYDDYWIEVGASVAGETGPQGPQGDTGPQGPAGNDGALSPNYVINGAFDIHQRGKGPFTNPTFFTDRFRPEGPGETWVVETKELTPGDIEAIGFGDLKYYLEVDLQVTNGSARFVTRIEDARTLAGQDVTISYWARSNIDGLLFKPTLRQVFLDSPKASAFTSDATLSTSWERYDFQFTLPSVDGKTINENSYLSVEFRPESGQTARIDITGVQLEAGSIATPFKRNANSIAGEELACFRYYYRTKSVNNFTSIGLGFASSGTELRTPFKFPTSMRAAPTLVPSGNFEINGAGVVRRDVTSLSGSVMSPEGCVIFANVSSGLTQYTAGQLRHDDDIDAYIEFTGAEL